MPYRSPPLNCVPIHGNIVNKDGRSVNPRDFGALRAWDQIALHVLKTMAKYPRADRDFLYKTATYSLPDVFRNFSTPGSVEFFTHKIIKVGLHRRTIGMFTALCEEAKVAVLNHDDYSFESFGVEAREYSISQFESLPSQETQNKVLEGWDAKLTLGEMKKGSRMSPLSHSYKSLGRISPLERARRASQVAHMSKVRTPNIAKADLLWGNGPFLPSKKASQKH